MIPFPENLIPFPKTLKVDAADAVDPYDASVARAPELTSVAMTSTVQLPLSDTDVASLGGARPLSRAVTVMETDWGLRHNNHHACELRSLSSSSIILCRQRCCSRLGTAVLRPLPVECNLDLPGQDTVERIKRNCC